jgi:hypothetical protein
VLRVPKQKTWDVDVDVVLDVDVDVGCSIEGTERTNAIGLR